MSTDKATPRLMRLLDELADINTSGITASQRSSIKLIDKIRKIAAVNSYNPDRDKLTCRELKEYDMVKFEASSHRYGMAEFIFCFVLKRGKVKELFIWPSQQPDVTEFFHVALPYAPQQFGVSAWTHKGMEEPRSWMFFWCKEHKCVAMRVYVPKQAKCFRVHFGSWFRIIFDTTCEPYGETK